MKKELYEAIKQGKIKEVLELIKGIDLMTCRDDDGASIVEIALQFGQVGVLKALIAIESKLLDKVNAKGNKILQMFCEHTSDLIKSMGYFYKAKNLHSVLEKQSELKENKDILEVKDSKDIKEKKESSNSQIEKAKQEINECISLAIKHSKGNMDADTCFEFLIILASPPNNPLNAREAYLMFSQISKSHEKYGQARKIMINLLRRNTLVFKTKENSNTQDIHNSSVVLLEYETAKTRELQALADYPSELNKHLLLRQQIRQTGKFSRMSDTSTKFSV